ncbi:MAG: hypothetical protein ACYTF9_06785 [Planctomycetota bacterium]|jgi:hypothetical protein
MALSRITLGFMVCSAFALHGCSRTYNATIEMTPQSLAGVHVSGERAFAIVENDGPGSVRATFDADHDRAETVTITPGMASGRTLLGSNVVQFETDEDGSTIHVEVSRATGFSVDPATPISE